MRRFCWLGAALLLCTETGLAQTDAPWFWFSRTFITNEYPADSAFGQMGMNTWAIASNHADKCGGADAEVHIGTSWYDHLGYANASVSGPDNTSSDVTPKWGVVVELTNVQEGNGDNILRTLPGTTDVIFDGYFRAWNEGHWKGSYYPHRTMCWNCILRSRFARARTRSTDAISSRLCRTTAATGRRRSRRC